MPPGGPGSSSDGDPGRRSDGVMSTGAELGHCSPYGSRLRRLNICLALRANKMTTADPPFALLSGELTSRTGDGFPIVTADVLVVSECSTLKGPQTLPEVSSEVL